ncbi:DMT family transporter [Brachymonas denitrificans]|uniref:DMT family transporter n=1 Tax=Brachymonas denitrificans TaxID=28220 RepID=UPI001BCB582C|nr:DMT family transporter [Brachymonas denitrificans]
MRPSDYARLLLLGAIWGFSFLFMRMVAPVIGAIPTAFFRVLFASLGLIVILLALRTRWDFRGKLRQTLLLGAINSGVPFLMYTLAARLLPAGYSAIFNATAPLMGVLIGALFFHEAATARKLIGVTVGLAGVTLLTAVGPVAMGWPELLGALACLVATSCYGISGFLTQRWIHERGGLNPKLVATGSQFGATLLLLPFFAASATLAPPPSWGNPSLWLALAALGLLCTAWAYILFFRLMENIGPVRSLTVTFLVPAFGVLWGVLFLGEQVSWAHLAGGGMIGLALWLVVSHPGQKAARP